MSSAKPLRILILEDSVLDAELEINMLQEAGFEFEWQRVQTATEYAAHLDPLPDLILADNGLPQFDPMTALQLLRDRGLDIPFIIVSGTIGEDLAVAAMKQGAADYVLKDRLARLGEAVRHALQQKQLRDENRRAEQALHASEERFRGLIEYGTEIIAVVDATATLTYITPSIERVLGYTPAELIGKSSLDFIDPDDTERAMAALAQLFEPHAVVDSMELRARHKDHSIRILEITSRNLLDNPGIRGIVANFRDITERKRAEEELRKLSRAVEQSPSSVVITDLQGNIEYVNPKFTEVTGYTLDETIGKNPRILKSGDTAPDVYQQMWATIKSGRDWHGEFHNRKKNGELYWESASISPITDAQGKITHFVAVKEDITGRKAVEGALAEERNLLRTLLDSLPDAIYFKDVDSRIVLDNIRNRRNLGIVTKPEDTLGKTDFDFHPRELAQQFFDDEQKIMKSGEPLIDHEELDIDPEGRTGWHLTTKVPLRDQTGKIIGIVGISRDISERKRAEEELRQSEAAEHEQRVLAEALRDSATALISSLEPETVMTRLLDNLDRVIPHEAANIMLIEGENARIAFWHGYMAVDADYLKAYRIPLDAANLRYMLSTRAALVVEDTRTYADWKSSPEFNSTRSYAGVPIQAHGQIIGFLSLDSTQPGYFTQRHAEKLKAFADQAALAIENAQLYDQLRQYAANLEARVEQRTSELAEEKERVEAILNSSSDAIVVTDLYGIIGQKNPSFRTMFAYKVGEARGQHLAILAAASGTPRLLEALHEVVVRVQSTRVEIVAVRKDGSTFDADFVLSAIVGPDKKTSGVVCGVRDISEHKRLEAGLRQALEQEKELNELKTRFISMVSHEFRTPLTAILGSTDLLRLGMDKMTAERKQKHLDRIQESITRMTDLLDDVLTIGRAEAGRMQYQPEPINFQEFCRELAEEMQSTAGKKHIVTFSWQGDVSDAVMDRTLLRHIITNLLSNAVKYSAAGSRVKFDVKSVDGRSTLRIRDSGIGIPEDDRRHLFEPFHRAKNVKDVAGTGLGLAIVGQAVEAHHGTIEYETQEGVGTTFTVVLPTIPKN